MRFRIVLLIIFIFILLFLSLEVYPAGEVNATGGFITQLNLTVVQQTTFWQGFLGEITFGLGSTTPSGINASGGNITAQNFFLSVPCNNPISLTGFVIFANTSNAPSGMVPGNLTYLDSLVTSGMDSPTNTFNETGTFFLEGGDITNVPTAFTFVNSSIQNATFKEGFLQDSLGNLVFVAAIDPDEFGYNTSTFDFQVIIPILNRSDPTAYSIFADLVYTCPVNDTWNATAPGKLFERNETYNQTLTLPVIQIEVNDITTIENNTLECTIQTSNLSITKNITHMIPAGGYSGANITLNYTILPGDPDGNILRTWFLENCTMYNTTGGVINRTFYNESDYPVYTKTTPWYRIVSGDQIGIDVANAYSAFKFNQRAYFGHNDSTQQDINFAFRKLIGTFKFEAICDDGIDNEGDGLIDEADNDCLALFFGPANHSLFPQVGGIGTFSFEAASVPPSGCAGNICSFTVGVGSNAVTVSYTQEASPGGQFKVKYVKNSIDNQITFMTVSSVGSPQFNVTNGTTNLYNLSGATGLLYKIMLPELGPPFTRVQANSRPAVTESDTFTGNLNQVTNITLNTSLAVNNYTISFDAFIGSGVGDQNFTLYVDNGEPFNVFENDTNLNNSITTVLTGTQTNLANACNDGVNNDLNYDNSDCQDPDCDGIIIGVTPYGDQIRCEYATETICWDGFDNDGDGAVDCADSPDCNLRIGAFVNASGLPEKKFIGGANVTMCEQATEGINNYTSAPSSCNDSFDNDADNNAYLHTGYSSLSTDPFDSRGLNIDCYDAYSCWGRGNLSSTAACPLFENTSNIGQCNDTIDNDHDIDIQGGSSNWLSVLVPDPGLDNSSADCDDYDCYGAPNCPWNETGADNLTCFDNIDNDLDAYYWTGSNYATSPATQGGTDCNDPDCFMARNPNTGVICLSREFNKYNWNFCWNTADNDFDGVNPAGQSSCIDNRFNSSNTGTTHGQLINYSDCWAMFGYCGPCPTYENYTAFSCGDGIDNDYDDGSATYGASSAGADCADTDCLGEFGNRQGDLCVAAGSESTVALCSDSFDNDNDGNTDCADSDCSGVAVTGGTCGAESTAGNCNDDFDNDNDGDLDCADSGCFGVGVCSPAPIFGALTTIPTSTSGSVSNGDIDYVFTARVHRNKPDVSNWTIKLTTASGIDHSSGIVQVVLGTSLDNLSFDINESNITLSGASALDFNCSTCVDYTQGVLNLEDSGNNGLALNGGQLDLTVSIPVPQNHALGTETFPISANTGCAVGCGVSQPSTQNFTVYENTVPRIEAIEIEPSAGTKLILAGETLAIRAIANDSASGGLTESNISACNFYLNGTSSSQSDCIYEPTFTADATLTVYVNATDTVGNTNATEVSSTFTVDVQPKDTTSNYSLGNASFFNSTENSINIGTFSFLTGDTDTFAAACLLVYTDDSGALVATDGASITNDGSYSTSCNGTATVPAAVLATDGVYYLTVNVTDSDSDTVESSPKAFFVCEQLTSTGTHFNCAEADFDNDGATEGLISNFTYFNTNTNTTINLTCDTCPGQVNLNSDIDGDGIDDVCDGNISFNFTIPECNDGIDNDGDGLIDYPDDPGCSALSDDDEFNLPISVGVPVDRGPGGGGKGWDPRFASAKTLWDVYEEEPVVTPGKIAKIGIPGIPEIPKPFALAKLPREITVEYLLESLIPIIIRLILIMCLWIRFTKKLLEL